MKTIYTNINDQQKQKAVNLAAGSCKAEVRTLSREDLPKSIGEIMGIPFLKASGSAPQIPVFYAMPEMLLFSGLTEQDLDLFLSKYKSQKVAPVALKAVVTPYNISWTLYDLLQEISKEHAELHKKK